MNILHFIFAFISDGRWSCFHFLSIVNKWPSSFMTRKDVDPVTEQSAYFSMCTLLHKKPLPSTDPIVLLYLVDCSHLSGMGERQRIAQYSYM